MGALSKHWSRIAVTLIPLFFALLHASGLVHIGVFQRLDDIIYDARLRATMPRTLDERIVIVDIDEKSLAEVGRWPWGRNRMSELSDALFDQQKVALVGFDVVFAEADDSSGLKRLRQLAAGELRDQAGDTRIKRNGVVAGRHTQYSSGSKKVVTERSPSVSSQTVCPPTV